MAKQPSEQIADASAEALAKSGQAAEKIIKGSADALTESRNTSKAAVEELTKAYRHCQTNFSGRGRLW